MSIISVAQGRDSFSCHKTARLVGRLSLALLLLSATVNGQTAEELTAVRRIYVAPLGNQQGAEAMRREIVKQLRKSKNFALAASPAEADAVLTGTGELWLRGYYSLNPRSGVMPSNGTPLYDGSLSVELKGKNDDTVWSYLVTPREPSANAAKELGKELVSRLREAERDARREARPHETPQAQ